MTLVARVQPPHPSLRLFRPERIVKGQFWDRRIWYRSPEFETDAMAIGKLKPGAMDEIRPSMQLRSLFSEFSLCARLTHNKQFKKVRKAPQHVFELKTADVRVFGWVLERDVFVACRADVLENLKGNRIPDPYHAYFADVVRLRDEMGLGCVQSEDLNDHFTNL